MQVSAEIRWFWENEAPHELRNWFHDKNLHPCAAGGGGEPRKDDYVIDHHQSELGLKRRGRKPGFEVKGLVAVHSTGITDPFNESVELWSKWTSEPLDKLSIPTISIIKTRWLRKFDTALATPSEISLDQQEAPLNHAVLPDRGCNVELTEIQLSSGNKWWTFGFEAFGSLETVEADLRIVAGTLAARKAPSLSFGIAASYPEWLKDHITDHTVNE